MTTGGSRRVKRLEWIQAEPQVSSCAVSRASDWTNCSFVLIVLCATYSTYSMVYT